MCIRDSPQPGFSPDTHPGFGYAPPTYPEESQALAALLVGILGLFMCLGAISPFGWVMANKELTAISSGRRDPSKKDLANAAKVVSIVGTVMFAMFLVGVAIVALFAIASLPG